MSNFTDPDPTSATQLPRSLSAIETWGFGLTGLTLWIGTAPPLQAALGAGALLVWLPCVLVSMVLNIQVQRLGLRSQDVAGGTPNYTARLLKSYPGLARYAAIGYWIGWISVPAVNAIVLTDLIKTNLEPFGIACPQLLLKVAFTAVAFVLAFSGTRALSILHLVFVLPAIGLILLFCIQGLGWIAVSPSSPGLMTTQPIHLSFPDWAKWYFIATYAAYAGEVAASFTADSEQPTKTLRFLSYVAWLVPIVYLGGSWVLLRLAIGPGLDDTPFTALVIAAKPFWGQSAYWMVTLLVAFPCLLGSATTAANTPRILHQLALDGLIAPVFGVVSRRGVLGSALLFCLVCSLGCLVWGDVTRVVMVTGTSFLVSFIGLHFALWLGRGKSEALFPWFSLGCMVLETIVLVVGGLAWGWQDLLIGLLLPIGVLLIDRIVRRVPLPLFKAQWWIRRYSNPSKVNVQDFVVLQVVILILLIGGATIVGWSLKSRLIGASSSQSESLLVILLVTLSFIGVAIACWTTLPQIAAIDEAREKAENLFITALDAILVLDEDGYIIQTNPAAELLFQMPSHYLVKQHLSDLFPALTGSPAQWTAGEQTLHCQNFRRYRILEATISQSSYQSLPGYTVMLRDVTERHQADSALRRSEAELRQKADELEQALQNLNQTQAQLVQTEKISSLGQLVAGVAHEVNNPVCFITGNLEHAKNYTQDLIALVELYQQHLPAAPTEIVDRVEEIDLNYLLDDLPKLLESMKVGTDRIRDIMTSLRIFSRVDADRMQPADLHAGIDSTLLILQHRLKANPDRPAIQLTKTYSPLPLVECFAGQLNQVFMNLLANAIDALEEHNQARTYAEIRQQPNQIEIRSQVKNGFAVIAIADNGSGIPESVQKRLFETFFTTKSAGKGTGMGLSISRQIIQETHKGHLTCISSPGQGTTFVIEIPLQQDAAASDSEVFSDHAAIGDNAAIASEV